MQDYLEDLLETQFEEYEDDWVEDSMEL